MRPAALLFFSCVLLVCGKAASQMRLPSLPDSLPRHFPVRILPHNFYNQHLSFSCKKEVQLQKLTSLPLYIRLGSKDYVDYLERKPNATWRKP